MKKSKYLKILILVVLILCVSGCTKSLKDSEGKIVTTESGQSLTENILCRPTDENMIAKYQENGVDLESIPECKDLKFFRSGDGLWETVFVNTLAFFIMSLSKIFGSAIISMIAVTIIIRLLMYPVTKSTVLQSENMKKAQPEIQKIEEKFRKRPDTQENMMMKNQETLMVYKKYGINPMASCLFSLIQIPLLFAFLEAIQRIPALYEENFLWMSMGTTPFIGIKGGNFVYLLLVVFIGVITFYSFKMTSNQASTANGKEDKEYNPMGSMGPMMTVMIVLMSFGMPAALGVYWFVSSFFSVLQNYLVKRSKKNG